MPVANENNKKDINNSQEGAQSGKPAAPKKKLNIVFRKQNSTSIKELPKRLKNAADMSEHKGKAESSQGNAGAAKRPRPLPAGTKPVRPAANLSDKKAEAAAATENIIKPQIPVMVLLGKLACYQLIAVFLKKRYYKFLHPGKVILVFHTFSRKD